MIFTITEPPVSELWFTVSNVLFSEAGTLSIPLFELSIFPPLLTQLIQDSPWSRIGQKSRPNSPIMTTMFSVLGGANIDNVTESPFSKSTIVEF